jgi:hypothetical protein
MSALLLQNLQPVFQRRAIHMPNEFRGYRNNAIRRTIGLIKGAAEQPTEPVSDSGRIRSII